MTARLRAACAWLAVAAAGSPATALAETLHLYSYDPADQATREASGGLTFEVKKGLLHSTVLSLMATDAKASAPLRRVAEGALPGALDQAIDRAAGERDLYEVRPSDEGPALIAALCPGSKRAWLAFGRVRFDQDLKVEVLGDKTGGGLRLCRSLAFNFHGEWKAPPSGPIMRERNLPHGRYPGT